MHETNGNNDGALKDPSGIALAALGWILEDGKRAERMLDLTGLTPDRLRDALGSASLQAAILRFLENYEPDLIACAYAIGISPEALVTARRSLEA
jgi:hypothetical protein